MEFSVLFESEIFFGNGILESLHAWDGSLGWLLESLSFVWHYLGSNIFFMALLAITYIVFSPRLGISLSWGLLTAGVINSLLKYIFSSPRPFGLDDSIASYQNTVQEFAFGFPSGHAHTSVVIWGLLIYYVPSLPVRILSGIVIVFMPFARMYMGVHFLGDVVGGFLIGLVNLGLVIWFREKFPDFPDLNRYQSQTRIARTYILAILAISLSPVLLLREGLQKPELHSLDTTIISSAALGGFMIGLILLKVGHLKDRIFWSDYKNSEVSSLQAFGVRLLVFVLSVLVFYLLPGIVVKQFSWGNDILIRYLRYLIVGMFIVYFIPVILYAIANGRFINPKANE